MAKRGSDDGAPEKGKIRIFFAEVEGNNQSLQEALKTVVSAMNRGQTTAIRVPANGHNVLGAQPDGSGAPEQAAEVVDDEVVAEAEETPTPARKRGPGKADRNVGIKLVPNLDFHP